jgi:hypothetical protein
VRLSNKENMKLTLKIWRQKTPKQKEKSLNPLDGIEEDILEMLGRL